MRVRHSRLLREYEENFRGSVKGYQVDTFYYFARVVYYKDTTRSREKKASSKQMTSQASTPPALLKGEPWDTLISVVAQFSKWILGSQVTQSLAPRERWTRMRTEREFISKWKLVILDNFYIIFANEALRITEKD